MRAAIFNGPEAGFSIETVADPQPRPGGIVLKVGRCGICGSDLHMTEPGSTIACQPGTILGHEYSGEIVAIGAGVEGLRIGDRVTALPMAGCGHCPACRAGRLMGCPERLSTLGGFAEYVECMAASAIRLPAALSLADGALCEPLAVGLHGVAAAAIRPGSRVAVLGGGAVALAVTFWAARQGAGRVVASSRSPRRAPLLEAMGASAFVASGTEGDGEIVEALGGPPDIVFETIGIPGAIDRAVGLVRPTGRVVSMGFCTVPEPFRSGVAAFKEVSLLFAMSSSVEEMRQAVDTLDAGHVEPRLMVTGTVPLGDLPQTFDRLRCANAETKVQVAPWS